MEEEFKKVKRIKKSNITATENDDMGSSKNHHNTNPKSLNFEVSHDAFKSSLWDKDEHVIDEATITNKVNLLGSTHENRREESKSQLNERCNDLCDGCDSSLDDSIVKSTVDEARVSGISNDENQRKFPDINENTDNSCENDNNQDDNAIQKSLDNELNGSGNGPFTLFRKSFHRFINICINWFRKWIPHDVTCPICCETYSFPQNIYRMKKQCCSGCNEPICYECCYRHVMSIVSDRTSNRNSIRCPFTNTKDEQNQSDSEFGGWTDVEIRHYIKRHHSFIRVLIMQNCSRLWNARRWDVLIAFPLLLQFLFPVWSKILCLIPILAWLLEVSLQNRLRSSFALPALIVYVCYTWSKTVQVVLLFCAAFFIRGRFILTLFVLTHYRNTIRRQVSNLRALFHPGYLRLERDIKLYENWSIEAALAMNCKKEQDHIVRCPIPNCENLWLIPKKYRKQKMKAEESYLRLLVGPGNDRKIHCDSCNVDFCGLCQRPWANFYHPSKGHSGVSCVKYARQCTVLENDDGYAAVAFIAGARACPKCSIRVQRSDGCNHMTCPCGMEWCYVCGKRWSNWHYGCRDGANNNSICVIS